MSCIKRGERMKAKITILALSLLIIKNVFCASSLFDDVLLIINYNHAHYNTIPLLEEIYKPYFKNIVFYGPSKHSGVHELQHNQGYLSYLCIADAMKKYPNFQGYFFLMDDCIFNAWLLKDFDATTIWAPDILFWRKSRGNPIDFSIKPGTKDFSKIDWVWWSRKSGYEAMTKAYKELPKDCKAILEKNWGKNHVVASFSDFFYIPAKYREVFIELAVIYGKHEAFLETALPTILSCLCLKEEWNWLYCTGTGYPYNEEYKAFNQKFHLNHPIKLSYESNRTFIKELFAKMLNS